MALRHKGYNTTLYRTSLSEEFCKRVVELMEEFCNKTDRSPCQTLFNSIAKNEIARLIKESLKDGN